MRFLLTCCLLCLALPLFANLVAVQTISADVVPAVGDGYVQIARSEGFIELPAPIAPAARLAAAHTGELKGPVKIVRTSSLKKHHHTHLDSVEEYDRQGRLIRQQWYDVNNVLCNRKDIIFSPRGNRCETEVRWESKTVTGYDEAGRELFQKENYTRNKHGRMEYGYLVTHGYDSHGRENAWREVIRDNGRFLRGEACVRQFDANGLITHVTKWARKADPASGNITVKTYKYDARKRLICYTSTTGKELQITATWNYGPAGVVEQQVHTVDRGRTNLVRYRYDAAGHLLTREEHASSYLEVDADGNTTWVDSRTPISAAQTTPPVAAALLQDPPLTLRTVYRYDHQGRLTRVAHYDGKNAPSYQRQEVEYHGHNGPMTLVYSYIDYHYDHKGNAHYTAFTTDGKAALATWTSYPDYSFVVTNNAVLIAGSLILDPKHTRRSTDSHGNWIRWSKHGEGRVRKISYYR